MTYLEQKIIKKTRRPIPAAMAGMMLVRIAIIAFIVFGVFYIGNLAINLAHNAPIEEWKLNHYRNQHAGELIQLRSEGKISEAQFDARVKYWANDSNAIREYKEDMR